jgi:hypothetical protein
MPAIDQIQGTVDMRQRNRRELGPSAHCVSISTDSAGINPLSDLKKIVPENVLDSYPDRATLGR